MTLATLRIERQRLELRCPDAGLDESRPLPSPGELPFDRWAGDYHRALRRADAAEVLLALGREMYTWLDGDERWLDRVRDTATTPLLFEIAGPPRPADETLAFVEAPWELLADAGGHLAARADLLFSPYRRLGVAAAALAPSEYRLSMVFMAAAPEGGVALSYEDEESAILEAAGAIGVDLVVEETGTLAELAERMAGEAPVDVLHVSCHGRLHPEPALLLETETGAQAPATAEEIARELGGNLPKRLLVLSACLTADPYAVLGSLCATMIRHGCPAALGWGGSVKDQQATAFAASLYKRLARKQPLEEAVARARHDLFAAATEPDHAGRRPRRDLSTAEPDDAGHRPLRDWHLARLYLGPKGGCAFTRAERARRRARPDAGHKEFLDVKGGRVPVASQREFVGRRRQLQAVLREMRRPQHAGVLVHGLGRHGKSSLAARIAHRMKEHALAVVFERYDAVAILDAIDRAVATREVHDLVAQHRDAARSDPATLAYTLRELLDGPCRDLVKDADGRVTARPLLLVADDFERVLDPPAGGLHRVQPDLVPAVRALLEAFAGADGQSRLLITSRYRFTLPHEGRDLAERLLGVHLAPMLPHEAEKQATAKDRSRGDRGGTAADRNRTRRCIRAALGNPGLQDLLFTTALEAPAACDRMLDEMERYLSAGQDPGEEKLRELFESLAIRGLLDLLATGERELLRASTLFTMPVPLAVLAELGRALRLASREATGDRLLALGLWDAYPDPVSPEERAALVNPLVRPRLERLSGAEDEALAGSVALPLFQRWGGAAGNDARPGAADLELTRLGLAASAPAIVAATAHNAVAWVGSMEEYVAAAELGRRAIQALDAHGEAVPLGLLRIAGEACHRVGDVDHAGSYLGRALDGIRTAADTQERASAGERAALLVGHARLLVEQGSPDAALAELEAAEILLRKKWMWRERAVALGDIARIRNNKGDVDEALRLHQEELDVYEQLGDRRSRALTLGDIARIRRNKGDVAEALRLHQEALEVYEQLGDRRSRAVTLGDIARIRRNEGDAEEALRLLQEKLQTCEQLGDRRSRAVTLGDIARILTDKGELDEARRLHEERLMVFEQLGDADGLAHTLWSIGRIEIEQRRGVLALKRLEDAYDIYTRLGRLDGICSAGRDLGAVLYVLGARDRALSILERALDGFERLGQTKRARDLRALIKELRRCPAGDDRPRLRARSRVRSRS